MSEARVDRCEAEGCVRPRTGGSLLCAWHDVNGEPSPAQPDDARTGPSEGLTCSRCGTDFIHLRRCPECASSPAPSEAAPDA